MANDYVDRTSKEDMISLMERNLDDGKRAISYGNYISASQSFNNAAFWAERIHTTYGSD